MKRSWGLVLLALLAGTCFAQRGEPPAELKEQVAKVNKLVDDLDRTKNGKIDPNVKPNREWTDPRTGKKYPYYTSKERRAEAVKKIEAELESAQKELAEAKASLPARIHAAKMEVGQVAVFHWSMVETRTIAGPDGRASRISQDRDTSLAVRVIEIVDKETKLVEVIDPQITRTPK